MVNINGPLKVVRLEGKIGKIKKVVYLLMDIHMNLIEQTKCETKKNIDIQDYIKNELQINDENNDKNKTERMLDIFIECGSDDKRNYGKLSFKYRDQYIAETIKTIIQINNDKEFKYSRYHMVDIREYLDTIAMHKMFSNIKSAMSGEVLHKTDVEKYVLIVRQIEIFVHNLAKSINQAHKKNKLDKKIVNRKFDKSYEEDFEDFAKIFVQDGEKIERFMDKIYNLHYHKEIKIKLIDCFNHVETSINELQQIINNMYEYMSTESKSIMYNSEKNINFIITNKRININTIPDYEKVLEFDTESYSKRKELYSIILDTMTLIMDIYVIRRLLDKDYITNCVIYTGAFHSINYIQILVNNFDFEITHISDMNKGETISDYTKVVKKSNFKTGQIDIVKKFFNKDYMTQCSDISNFPKNFS
jgi:hypothetical protein